MIRKTFRRNRRRRTAELDGGSVFAAVTGSVAALVAERQQEPRPLDQLLKHLLLMFVGGAIAEELGGPHRTKVFADAYAEALKQHSTSPDFSA